MCNYAEHGSVRDVRYIENGGVMPIFEADDRPAPVLEMIAEQRRSFAGIVDLLKNASLEDTLAMKDEALGKMIATLYGILSKDNILQSVYLPSHQEEDMQAMKAMGL